MKNTNVMLISNRIFFLIMICLSIGVGCSKKAAPPKQTTENVEREYLPFPDESIKPGTKTPSSELPTMTTINSISEIHLPFTIDSAALVKQINLLIPKTLYEDRDISDDKMIVIAEKMDSISLSISPNSIMYSVPFKLHVERDVAISTVKADGSLRLYFSTEYKILENWAFETKTTITNHEWIESPKVKLGFLNIPIESIADRIVARSADMVCKNIDAQLMEEFRLREYIDQAWRKLQQPIQITDTPVVSWLLIQPQKIMMEPIITAKGNVKTSVIFRSLTDLAFGKRPDLPYAGILPTFEQLKLDGEDSLIAISIKFPLKRAEILLTDFFKGQEFRDGNKVMIIDSLHITGKGEKIEVEAYVSGSYPARLLFEGKPVYNTILRRFELKNMAYTLKSKNLLVRAASWILKKNIDKKMSELLVYEMGSYFDEGKKNLEKTLSQFSLRGFKMRAEIADIWALDPIMENEDAEIRFLSNGKFRIIIDELIAK